MKGAPWFKFFPADFIGGTVELSSEERGSYITLLCAQWSSGSLPGEHDRLERIAGGRVSDAVRGKFAAGQDGRLRNTRLESHREEATDRSRAAAHALANRKWRPIKSQSNDQSESNRTIGKRSIETQSNDQSSDQSEARGYRLEARVQNSEERDQSKNSSARAFSGHPLSAMVESLGRCQAVDGFPANRVGPMQWANVLQAFPVDDVTARAVEEFVVDCLTMGRWDDRKSPVSRLRSWIERARKSQGQPAAAPEKPRGTWDLEKQIELLRSERERLYMSDFQNTGGPERNADRYAKWLDVSKKVRELQGQIAGKA